MAVLGAWLVLTSALIVGLDSAGAAHAVPSSGSGTSAVSHRCRSGSVHAVIAHEHKCLRAGQRCSRRRDRAYHRYGFHCHSGRLTRRRRPPPPPPPLPPGVIAAVNLSGEAWALTAGAGGVWVQEGDTGVARITTATNRISARVANIDNLAFTGDELWGAARDRLVSLDLLNGELLSTIALPTVEAHRVAAGEGALWVPAGDTVLRVDRATRAVETIHVSCPGAREAEVAYGSLWVACKEAGNVLRIDASTRQIVATIATGEGAHDIAVGAGAVWVSNYLENTISRIDPASNVAVAKVAGVGAKVGLTVENGLVWAATREGIARIAPATNAISGRLTLPAASFFYGLAFADGSLWVSASSSARVYRVDPASVR